MQKYTMKYTIEIPSKLIQIRKKIPTKKSEATLKVISNIWKDKK